MATVYLARDLKHDRDVALKVLRPELGAVLGTERFLAEIRVTARLDHPHILTLIDSGATNGSLFYVLPLVRGESLRDKLSREKQLGLDETLTIARQVAAALDYAHRQGVVHRDIKPENILLQEGEAILTDFGIALAVRGAGGPRITETGLSLGTPQYMSPEQAAGEQDLDARSDVYSLAAVLYEMLAGEPPVTGPTVQAIIAKLLVERPTALRVVRDTVPVAVESAVMMGLAKSPADRFPSASAFAAALVAAPGVADRARVTGRRRLVRAGGGLVLVAAAALAVRFGWVRRGQRMPSFRSAVPVQLTTSGMVYSGGQPSPDGSQMAYSERHCDDGGQCGSDLYIRETSGEGIATVASRAGHRLFPLSWSPDGHWLVYVTWDEATRRTGGLYIVSQRGGVQRQLLEGIFAGGFVAADTLVVTSITPTSDTHWLVRMVASTGRVVDSVPLQAGPLVGEFLASPDGARFAVLQVPDRPGKGASLAVVGRDGRVTDSLPVSTPALLADAFSWVGPDRIAWAEPSNATGNVLFEAATISVVSRRVNRRGRLLPGVDTLTTQQSGQPEKTGISSTADGRRLFLTISRVGEATYWTASRRTAAEGFRRGRRVSSSTAGEIGNLGMSPGGGWIVTHSGNRGVVRVEPFSGGQNHAFTPVDSGDFVVAISPLDDSVTVLTRNAAGRLVLTSYPLPDGPPSSRVTADSNTLFGYPSRTGDGRVVVVMDGGRVIRIYGGRDERKEFRVPDSLGFAKMAEPSPTGSELMVVGYDLESDRRETVFSRLALSDGRFAPVARVSARMVGDLWWSSDGWIRFSVVNYPGDMSVSASRLRPTGGPLETEPRLDLGPNAFLWSQSLDALHALVREQSSPTTDVWSLTAVGRE
jgi:dipeptidyl aminopeptidase/acylaminoacyl peptidase